MLNELSFIQSIQSFINTVCNHQELAEFVFLDVSWNQSTIRACPDIVNKRTKWKTPPQNSCCTLSSVCLRGGGGIQVEVTTSSPSEKRRNILTHTVKHQCTHHLPHIPLGVWLSSLVEGRAMTSFWYCDWNEKNFVTINSTYDKV